MAVYMMLGFVGGSWSRGLCPLVQNLRRLLASAEPFSWQAEGPQCPFGLLFAPCRRAEVLSWGFATRNVALGSALDSAEGLWHQSPERSGGRQYARQLTGAFRPPRCLADVTEEALAVLLQLQSKSPMQHLDKFGVVEVPTVVRAKEKRQRRDAFGALFWWSLTDSNR